MRKRNGPRHGQINRLKDDRWTSRDVPPLGYHMTRKYDNGDQPSSGETTWTNTGATRSGRRQYRLTWRPHAEAFAQPRPGHYDADDDDTTPIVSVVPQAHLSGAVFLCVFFLTAQHSGAYAIKWLQFDYGFIDLISLILTDIFLSL